ncbi:hypothetical protein E2C01_102414 [Portunus trituberculatus]|uniref:Uncharacterized protein n=1 Tax=Portunus trituberculatus TaxID=210409 RepID=A0A5B7KP55_PORTR|nr:hypothetical protein [Portunus trituberculatus]
MLVLLLLQELKEDLHIIKNRMDMLNPECGANKIVKSTIENPFEMLHSFGFKASALEKVSELLHNIFYKFLT